MRETILVFHEGKLHSEEKTLWYSMELPHNSYVCNKLDNWYVVRNAQARPINLCDVPKELRMQVLLLRSS